MKANKVSGYNMRMLWENIRIPFVLIIAVLNICVSNDWLEWAYGFSPVSLTQLELFNGFAPKWGINLAYAEKFFMIAIISLSVLCVIANYKETIISRMKERHIQ